MPKAGENARQAAVMNGQLIFDLGYRLRAGMGVMLHVPAAVHGGRSGPAVRVLEPVGFQASGTAAFLRLWKLGERVEHACWLFQLTFAAAERAAAVETGKRQPGRGTPGRSAA